MSEFSRPLRLETLGTAPNARAIDATPGEREALARRFDLAALDALDADLTAQRIAGGVALTGHVRASGAQSCVISGLSVPFAIDEPLTLRFEPAPEGDEIELSDADLDILPLEGDTIDLGEAAAQALGLALDPYPKASELELAEHRRLLLTEEAAARAINPFAVLGERTA